MYVDSTQYRIISLAMQTKKMKENQSVLTIQGNLLTVQDPVCHFFSWKTVLYLLY